MGYCLAARVTGVCSHHRWMRWQKVGRGKVAVKVRLGAKKPSDFCKHCKKPRSEVEGAA